MPDLSSVVYALGFDWLIHSTEASSELIAASVTGELESIAEALLTNHKNGDVKLFFITIPEVNFLFDLIISYMRMEINGLFVFSSALEKIRVVGPKDLTSRWYGYGFLDFNLNIV